jgi:hypothetical protein
MFVHGLIVATSRVTAKEKAAAFACSGFLIWRSGRESSPALRQGLPTLKKTVFPLVRVDKNTLLQSVAP